MGVGQLRRNTQVHAERSESNAGGEGGLSQQQRPWPQTHCVDQNSVGTENISSDKCDDNNGDDGDGHGEDDDDDDN